VTPATDDHKLISVVTVTHNSSHKMRSWLAGIAASGARERMEVCIVDSGSSPAELQRTKDATAGQVDKFLELPNVGYGAASNEGAANTSAPILLFMNPDNEIMSLPAQALSGAGLNGEIIGAFARNPDRPMAYTNFPTFGEEAQRLTIGAWIRTYGRTTVEPAWVAGAAMLIEREKFDGLGGFSDAFFLYFEDADLCARHRARGGKVQIADDFIVIHDRGDSAAEESHENLRGAVDSINHQSARHFASRHGAAWQGPVLYGLLVVAYMPRRFLVEVLREKRSFAEAVEHCRCLLSPRRALRRLDAVPPGASRA
jgi:N-acetylglucosaminyl-diphospho-decaprenol L-rhamnosyltransferase